MFTKLILIIINFFLLTNSQISVGSAEIIVQDFRGKTIRLPKPAERIVCLIESALTGIYMLKQGHKIVGIPSNVYHEGLYYSDTFKYYSLLDERIKMKKIPIVGNWESVNIEKVISLKPDLIIIWSLQEREIQAFENLGIPVYGVFIRSIDDIFKEIRDLGKLLDAKQRAEELLIFMENEIKKIDEIGKNIKSPKKVYFSWAQLNFLRTSCQGSIVNELISKLGGINICGNLKAESISLNLEKLIKLNPEVIIMWYSKSLGPEDIKKDKRYNLIKAVQLNAIYQFSDTFFYDLWTPKFLFAMKFMAKSVYPEFYEFDLEREKKRIINFLYGEMIL